MNPNDPDVIALTKAIFQHESGTDYNATGDAGTSHGAGQWQPATWKAQAQDVLGDPNAAMTPENQKAVAQVSIAKDKAAGLNPAQIAAKWNSGSPDGWENKIGTTTINGQQIKYNVPAYVKSVTDLYQQYKGQGGQGVPAMPQATQSGDSTQNTPGLPNLPAAAVPDTNTANVPVQQPTNPGFMQDLSSGNFGGAAVDAAKGVGNFLFPSVGDVYHDIKGDSTKTGLQQVGDAGSSLLSAATLIPGVGEIAAPLKAALGVEKGAEAANAAVKGADFIAGAPEGIQAAKEVNSLAASRLGSQVASKAASNATPGLLAQVGKNAALGGAYGVSGALGSGATDPNQIAQQGLVGAATGGVVGGAGSILQKAADVLPQRLVQGAIKNSNPDVAKYALTKSMGTPAKMLADSTQSLSDIGNQLGAALTHSNVSNVVVPSEQIIPKILAQFPNAELTPEALQNEINKIAPLQKGLTTKLFSGEGLSIDELHTLNSAIGANTFKTVFDNPEVRANRDIGNAFYQASKDIITTAAPDTAPLFDQYSKEKALNTALYKATQRGNKSQAITLPDLVALVSGLTTLGPWGGAAAFATERALRSPTVNLKAAGLLNKAAGNGINRVTAPATIGATGLLNQLMNQRATQGGI